MLKAVVVLVIAIAVAAGAGLYVMSHHAPAPATTPTSTATSSSATTSASTPSVTSTSSAPPATTTTTPSTTKTSTTSLTTTSTTTTASSTTPSSTTSTTTPSSSTSITSTTTTTTTPAQEIEAKALTIETILENYEKIALNIYYMNKTTGDESNLTMTMTQEPDGNIGGTDTVKVVFTVTNNNENEQDILTLWMSKDYSTVVKIDLNGQTFEGQQANMYGQQILVQANNFLLPYTYVGNIHLRIAEGTVEAAEAGWEITSLTPTTVTISGHTYKAYSVTSKNVADTDNEASNVDSTMAEISPYTWLLTHVHANMKDGSIFNAQILELAPKT